MTRLKNFSIALALLTCAVQTLAQGGMAGGMGAAGGFERPAFASLDTDENGLLTLDEIQVLAADTGRNMENFLTRRDTDNDSMLSEEEYLAGRANQGGN